MRKDFTVQLEETVVITVRCSVKRKYALVTKLKELIWRIRDVIKVPTTIND